MISSPTATETLAIPLNGISEAEIRIGFGGGDLTIGKAEPQMLLIGTFDGGVIQKSVRAGKIHLEPRTPGLPLVTWQPLRWNVGVSAEIPVDLRLDSGANRSTIDLTTLRIRRLDLHTGASETTVRLPEAGQTAMRVECGLASVTVHVPQGVAARIRGSVALGSTTVDETRFPRIADGWMSSDFEVAPNRVDLQIEGGFGSVRVV